MANFFEIFEGYMTNLLKIFEPHIKNLFNESSKFVQVSFNRIRIDQPNPNSKIGLKHSQAVVLVFENDVIRIFEDATRNQLLRDLENYKNSLRKLIIRELENYDNDGDLGLAFIISVDSEATDL